ncbi:MAG: phosphatidylserine decarboxylase family protein [Desulfobacterales bacterium]|nr:phosphatidylserine decarboxylase family protein [Desulfobacterales bacterium]
MNKDSSFSWIDKQNGTAFPIAKAGYPFIFFAGFSTLVFALLHLTFLTLIAFIITCFICYFFRDPDRLIPNDKNSVVSPADGKIIIVQQIPKSLYYDTPCLKISIFMSVFNVHVNRIPYDGVVTKIIYNPGKFFSANLDKASKDNEQNAVVLETKSKQQICFVQVAGLIARRIICNIQKGDEVQKGERFGMICFGSRLDVYLPPDSTPKVSVGDNVYSGTSILAELKE